MKPFLYILLLLSQVPSLTAQKNNDHWLTIEQADYELCKLSLNVLHQPTLANDEWVSILIENKDSISQKILSSNLEVKIQAFDNTNSLVKEGMFTSSDPSELIDNFGQNPIEVPKLTPGTHHLSKHISILSSTILGIPSSDFVRVEMSIIFSLELLGSERIQMEWDGLNFEFEWYKPNVLQTNQIENKLYALLVDPQNDARNYFTLRTLLNQESIASKVSPAVLIKSLEAYQSYPDQKLAILHYINSKFSTNQEIKAFYKKRLKQKDITSLHDLKELPKLWDDTYIPLISDWLSVAPLNIQVRIFDMLFLRQEKWKNNSAFSSELSNLLLDQYGDILYKLPTELTTEELQIWGSLATALGKSGDASTIGIICPFLENKKNLWGREMVLFTESLEAPRPTRVCDIALEAILNLQQKNIIITYKKNGFMPPYIYGEAEIIIDKVRSDLIKELISSNICQYNGR